MILLSLVAVGVLCCGLFFLEITTNPIKLWAAPNSRARIERRFFDANFRPFFRTEHIILRPIQVEEEPSASLQPFNRINLYDENVTYSPVFDKRFLEAALELQLAIQDLEVDGVRLTDICHQPLYPASEECNVQSVWGYWQNDVEKLRDQGE